jgi:hypothetical protein
MKHFFVIIILFVGYNSFSQDINSEVEKDLIAYFKLISEKNIDKALDYSNPKLFDIISREQMKNLLEAVYKMPNIEYKTGIPTFLKFEDLKNIEDVNYVKVYIDSPIEMKFNDIDINEEKVSRMILSFESKFGVGKVNYDEKTGFFKINAEKIIIASSDEKLKDWKFLTIDNPKMKVLLEKIIPSELLN